MRTSKELKIAQLVMLDILKELDRVCKNNNIEYWIVDGTLLGAVRHKGFIPWDDDIDVCMLPEDYEKFLKIASQDLNQEKFFLDYKETDPWMPLEWAKIRDRHSLFVEKDEEREEKFHQGISIDIFPMNYIKKDIDKDRYKKIFKRRRKLNKKGKHNLGRKLLSIIGFTKFVEKKYKEFFVDDRKSAEYVGYRYWWNQLYKYSDIFPLSEIEFEGLRFSCPNNPKGLLLEQYGENYMELPPEELRYWHAKEIKLDEKCFFEKELERTGKKLYDK